MKNKLKQISIFIVVVALGSSVCANKLYVKAANSISDAKNEKTNLERKKQETEKMLADLEKKKGNTLNYLEELDKQLSTLENKINDLSKKISSEELKLSKTQENLEEARATEAEQYEIMKKRIQYMYVNGNTEYLQILMTSDSIADFLNRSEYVKQISDYDRNMLQRYQKAKQEVMDKESTIAKSIVELNNMSQELVYEKSTVEVLISQKNTELQKYNDGISKSESEIADYAASIEKQEQLIDSMLEAERKKAEARAKKEAEARAKKEAAKRALEAAKNNMADASESSSSDDSARDNLSYSRSGNVSGSGYMWPTPASRRITCGFGYRTSPTAGASTNHKGIDIGASMGTTIVASLSGIVIKAGYAGGYGNYIVISHGNGICTHYAHCSAIYVSAGQSVSKGQSIGAVGSTGISTGPHLHFGVSVNGGFVNPLNYVSN